LSAPYGSAVRSARSLIMPSSAVHDRTRRPASRPVEAAVMSSVDSPASMRTVSATALLINSLTSALTCSSRRVPPQCEHELGDGLRFSLDLGEHAVDVVANVAAQPEPVATEYTNGLKPTP
jgi:hypothetical protein